MLERGGNDRRRSVRRGALGVAFALLAVSMAAGHARAQQARPRIIADAFGGTPALAELRTRAARVIADDLATGGYDVLSPDQGGADAFRALVRCDATPCMRPILQALGIEFGIVVTMWRRLDGECLLEATLYPRGGRVRIVSVHVEGNAIAGPAHDVARQLIEENTVQSRLPATPPNIGVVIVSGAGLDDEARPARSSRNRTTERRSPWNVAVGGTLVVSGLVPLVLGIQSARHDGQCASTVDDRCALSGPPGSRYYLEHRFGRRQVAGLSVGAVLTGAGLYFLAARPIRIAGSVSATGASLELAGSF